MIMTMIICPPASLALPPRAVGVHTTKNHRSRDSWGPSLYLSETPPPP